VGKTGLARPVHILRFCAVSSLQGTSKAGKLSENRRFFDKMNAGLPTGVFFFPSDYGGGPGKMI